jgi:hypothetical protein
MGRIHLKWELKNNKLKTLQKLRLKTVLNYWAIHRINAIHNEKQMQTWMKCIFALKMNANVELFKVSFL